MYSIQTTSGFVIDSKPYGEAGKALSIFTRDLGLVRAMAQGIRLEKSKLRYHAADYSFGEFSFVRGRDWWRLTSAHGYGQGKSQELIAKIALLLKRLLHGEEPHPELFDEIKRGTDFLTNNPDMSDEQLKTFESVMVLRILHSLGYVGKDEKLSDCLESSEITLELLKNCEGKRNYINQVINKGLKESHL